jgi:hypothetical protein
MWILVLVTMIQANTDMCVQSSSLHDGRIVNSLMCQEKNRKRNILCSIGAYTRPRDGHRTALSPGLIIVPYL